MLLTSATLVRIQILDWVGVSCWNVAAPCVSHSIEASGISMMASVGLMTAKESMQEGWLNNQQNNSGKQSVAPSRIRTARQAATFAFQANKRSSIDNAVEMAKSEPRVEVRYEEFDADPWALNCENGILDLRTRHLRQHDPDELMTKLANVQYDPAADCPRWKEFVKLITCGDADLAAFLQRSFGLALTADQSEQAVWFHHGDGSNGKGTFLTIVDQILGDYAKSTNVNAFVHKRQESNRSRAVAAIIGRRLVFAQEVDEGSKLSEQAVKELTGSDPVAYEYKYEN